MGTVTAIRQVNNLSTKSIFVATTKSEAGGTILPGKSLGVNVWIPWCTNSFDFPGNRATVGINFPDAPRRDLVALWQNNNQVCFSLDVQFHDPGDCVPTDCATGGDRLLVVRDDPANPLLKILITLTTLG